MTTQLPPTPTAAVRAWWQAIQDHDLAALERMTADDYLASGGPAGRTTTREELMAEARTFYEESTRIESWSVAAIVVLDLGSTAVCAYDWDERGERAGEAFHLTGLATDVLLRRDSGWVHQAHHVSLQPARGE